MVLFPITELTSSVCIHCGYGLYIRGDIDNIHLCNDCNDLIFAEQERLQIEIEEKENSQIN